jgi:hypothetical protein
MVMIDKAGRLSPANRRREVATPLAKDVGGWRKRVRAAGFMPAP